LRSSTADGASVPRHVVAVTWLALALLLPLVAVGVLLVLSLFGALLGAAVLAIVGPTIQALWDAARARRPVARWALLLLWTTAALAPSTRSPGTVRASSVIAAWWTALVVCSAVLASRPGPPATGAPERS
jgi:hypothetical protein